MNLNKIYNYDKIDDISDVFTLASDCGFFDGYNNLTKQTESGFEAVHPGFTVNACVESEDGVFVRSDSIKNTSGSDITIYDYAYRFCFEGGDYDVYTQRNHWQNESKGEWQKLVTGVCLTSLSCRTTSDVAPMLALWNRQSSRGVVFHLLPRFSWEMTVSRRTDMDKMYTVVEIRIKDKSLNLKLKKDETLKFSSVIYYEFSDRLSLDCHKLHKFFNKKYPRRDMPVMYNTWLAFFDRVNFKKISNQIAEAASLGCEYFTLDAGWFGDGDKPWSELIGQWTENLTGAYMGRVREISDRVHESGMKFGFWLEPERALKDAEIVREHPEYFITNNKDVPSYFIDFSNPGAREYITDVTCGLIEKFNADYIKFDFNDELAYDMKRNAFYDYFEGYDKYIDAIKERFPHLYLECCASGGYRFDLEHLRKFDSFWFTDNQSPYDGVEIIKNSILRIPPSALERWSVLVTCDGFTPEYTTHETKRTLATNDGSWTSAVSVEPEFMLGFMSGGAPALSCDLTKLDSEFKARLKEFISKYKSEKGFWKDASCRLLADTNQLTVLQYENGDKVKLVIYTRKLNQTSLTLYPVLEKTKYIANGKLCSAEELVVDSIKIDNPKSNFSYVIELN